MPFFTSVFTKVSYQMTHAVSSKVIGRDNQPRVGKEQVRDYKTLSDIFKSEGPHEIYLMGTQCIG